jgi:hypothetical protein
MTDVTGLRGSEPRVNDYRAARQGLATAREAAQRAGAYIGGEDARTAAALDRLRQKLQTGETLKTDVPRGYHLDITV